MLLASCGGGGGGAASNSSADAAATAAAQAAAKLVKEVDAGRLAKQATFGATPDVIDRIMSLGASGWLDEQFSATGSTYADLAVSVPIDSCGTDNSCYRHNFTREPTAMRFYANALSKPDQLRQRVAFALSQLIVASEVGVPTSGGLASLNEIFLKNAFGNYRDILMQATLNGTMGGYLNVADSNKTAPSENYARELLQLFSMGPDQLNMDGSAVNDSTGATIANYTSDDIKGVARALTGWTYARLNGGGVGDSNLRDFTQPMITVPTRYDTTAKTFLGITVPAGTSQADSVAAVVDAAFNNASTAPYVARYMIRNLVASNPTPGYVSRVAAVFANNGSNVRGDMKAVIRAILMDTEARGAASSSDNYGKLKEPVLMLTGIARAINMTSDGYVFITRDVGLQQPVFASPSVFNFYPPDYPLQGSSTLVSPASKLITSNTAVLRHNFVAEWTVSSLQPRNEFAAQTIIIGATGTTIDWTSWQNFGTDIDGMIDRIDLILMNRTMTSAQKAALKTAASAVTNADATLQARARAQVMLYVAGTSPLFQVDR